MVNITKDLTLMAVSKKIAESRQRPPTRSPGAGRSLNN
jgi:hypothetical protein